MSDRAAMSLANLRNRWGSSLPAKGEVPERVEIRGMEVETWVRRDDGSKGEQTNFELRGENDAKDDR